jgi:hypothetical protein
MASGAALPKSRIVSAFKFPPSLSMTHEEELRQRAISKEFALASGVRTAADNELRELNSQASPPCEDGTETRKTELSCIGKWKSNEANLRGSNCDRPIKTR